MNPALLAEAVLDNSTNDYQSALADIYEILRTLQSHLEMDVVFIGEFTDNKRIIKHVVKSDAGSAIEESAFDPISETYCNKIVTGEIPPLIKNTKNNAITQNMAVTDKLAIGCYLGVPIEFDDGHVYGTLCCFKHSHDESLRSRDLHLVDAFAELAGKKLSKMIAIEEKNKAILDRVQSVLNNTLLHMAFQPVYDLSTNTIATFEALARFDHPSQNTPDIWFREAKEVGLGKEMELLAIKKAISALDELPQEINISINISPEYIISGELEECLQGSDMSRLLIEITEHEKIESYANVNVAFERLRQSGARLAVDDVGAGHANFFHIIELQPNVIKLDMSLTRNIDTDFHRQALAKALIAFSRSVGARIIAEGVETAQELEMLKSLKVDKVQGYFIGKPSNLEEALLLCKASQ